MRKGLEKLRPPGANELLLSNDGDGLLEGSVSNFFVVCRKVPLLSFAKQMSDYVLLIYI